MFKHTTGWELNARMLRLYNDYADHPSMGAKYVAYFARIVREEIAQDCGLVWC